MDAKALGQQPANAVFPDTGTGHGAAFRGVTKRELFSAMAMQGILSNETFGRQMRQKTDKVVGDTVARLAFECADAILTELAKDQP